MIEADVLADRTAGRQHYHDTFQHYMYTWMLGHLGTRPWPWKPVVPVACVTPKVRKVMKQYGICRQLLATLWHRFAAYDRNSSGTVDMRAFYAFAGVAPSAVVDGVFRLVGVPDGDSLGFTDFVHLVISYCAMDHGEVLRFCFNVFDRDRNGLIEFKELEALFAWVGEAEHQHSLEEFKERWGMPVDHKIDFDDFLRMNKAFPLVCFPAFHLQSRLVSRSWGAAWWNTFKRNISEQRRWDERRLRVARRRVDVVLRRERLKAAFRSEGVRGLLDVAFARKARKAPPQQLDVGGVPIGFYNRRHKNWFKRGRRQVIQVHPARHQHKHGAQHKDQHGRDGAEALPHHALNFKAAAQMVVGHSDGWGVATKHAVSASATGKQARNRKKQLKRSPYVIPVESNVDLRRREYG